jgi:hypothetical protein
MIQNLPFFGIYTSYREIKSLNEQIASLPQGENPSHLRKLRYQQSDRFAIHCSVALVIVGVVGAGIGSYYYYNYLEEQALNKFKNRILSYYGCNSTSINIANSTCQALQSCLDSSVFIISRF